MWWWWCVCVCVGGGHPQAGCFLNDQSGDKKSDQVVEFNKNVGTKYRNARNSAICLCMRGTTTAPKPTTTAPKLNTPKLHTGGVAVGGTTTAPKPTTMRTPKPTTTRTPEPTAAPTTTGGNLCTTNGIKPGSVTQKVCSNTPDVCEVYIKKGNENGVPNIKTCRQYCNAYGIGCTAQYDDEDGCDRGKQYVHRKGTDMCFPNCVCVCVCLCRVVCVLAVLAS